MQELIDIAILQLVTAIKSGLCLNNFNMPLNAEVVWQNKKGIGISISSNTFFLCMPCFDSVAFTIGGYVDNNT